MPILLLPNAGEMQVSVAPRMQFALHVIAGVLYNAISQQAVSWPQTIGTWPPRLLPPRPEFYLLHRREEEAQKKGGR